MRAIEVEDNDKYALRGSALRRALEEDVNKGKHPFVLSECPHLPQGIACLTGLVATLGTTSSGAFDNMQEIGDVGGCALSSNSSFLAHLHHHHHQPKITPLSGSTSTPLGRALHSPVPNTVISYTTPRSTTWPLLSAQISTKCVFHLF